MSPVKRVFVDSLSALLLGREIMRRQRTLTSANVAVNAGLADQSPRRLLAGERFVLTANGARAGRGAGPRLSRRKSLENEGMCRDLRKSMSRWCASIIPDTPEEVVVT